MQVLPAAIPRSINPKLRSYRDAAKEGCPSPGPSALSDGDGDISSLEEDDETKITENRSHKSAREKQLSETNQDLQHQLHDIHSKYDDIVTSMESQKESHAAEIKSMQQQHHRDIQALHEKLDALLSFNPSKTKYSDRTPPKAEDTPQEAPLKRQHLASVEAPEELTAQMLFPPEAPPAAVPEVGPHQSTVEDPAP